MKRSYLASALTEMLNGRACLTNSQPNSKRFTLTLRLNLAPLGQTENL